MSQQWCQACGFYDSKSRGMSGQGFCKRYPPLRNRRKVDPQKGWPIMTNYEWCGEWKELRS